MVKVWMIIFLVTTWTSAGEGIYQGVSKSVPGGYFETEDQCMKAVKFIEA